MGVIPCTCAAAIAGREIAGRERGSLVRATVLASVTVLGLAGCASQRPATPTPQALRTLRIAVAPNRPPYGFRQAGQLVGLEVDFARELATALGRRLDLVEMGWDDLIPAVRTHRADMLMAGMTITRARQVQIAFSEPYLRSGLLAVTRSEDAPRFRHASNVFRTSEPVGVTGGTTAERFVREQIPTASVLVYPSPWAAMNELRQRRVTLVVNDAPVAIWFAGGDEANLHVLLELLDEEQIGWGLARDEDGLRTAVNQALARWRTDGTRDRILGRWVHYWQRLESEPVNR